MAQKTRNLSTELGASGTLITKGHIVAEEYNARLNSRRQALQMYDVMSRSDPDVHAALEVVKLPILAAPWSVKAARNADGKVEDSDKEIADHIEHELFHNQIDFNDTLYQACDMLDFGFSLFEKVLSLHTYNGKQLWGIDKLAFRKQTTVYAWETRDGEAGITQQTRSDTYDIPLDKLIVFTNKKRGDNYEGISLLRFVFRDWDMKDKLTLINAMALEKLAVGVPIIREDGTDQAGANDMTKAEEAMAEFRANEKGYIKEPKGITIEMLDMKGSSTKDVLPTLAMHKRAIFSSVLATFMDLGGSSGSGAQALSKDLTSLFLKSEEYVARTIASAINHQLIKQLCDLTYSELPNGYPELTYGNIGDDDIQVMSAAINQLMTAGALTADVEMEDVVRAKIGMPAMPEETKADYANNQELKRKAAEALANPDTITKQDTQTTEQAKKPVDKTKAAIDASKEAQRRVIEVIFDGD